MAEGARGPRRARLSGKRLWRPTARDKPCHAPQVRLPSRQLNLVTCRHFLERMMGLEPTTFCMASASDLSLPFAPVRSNRRFAEVFAQASERNRTRANAEPCLPCHGSQNAESELDELPCTRSRLSRTGRERRRVALTLPATCSPPSGCALAPTPTRSRNRSGTSTSTPPAASATSPPTDCAVQSSASAVRSQGPHPSGGRDPS
jgi:hypothetical protein